MRRVVATGLGLVNSLGCRLESNWANLLAGKSGIRKIDTFDVSDLPARIAGLVNHGDGTSDTFNADLWVSPKDQRRMDSFIIY